MTDTTLEKLLDTFSWAASAENGDEEAKARAAIVSFFSDATSQIACAQARLTAAVDVLDAITTPDGELRLPTTDDQINRLRIAFEIAKEVP